MRARKERWDPLVAAYRGDAALRELMQATKAKFLGDLAGAGIEATYAPRHENAWDWVDKVEDKVGSGQCVYLPIRTAAIPSRPGCCTRLRRGRCRRGLPARRGPLHRARARRSHGAPRAFWDARS